MNPTFRQVIEEVLRSVVPSAEDKDRVRSTTELVKTLVLEEIKKTDLILDVVAGGSVAKDTWLRDDVDIDLFMPFPTSVSKKDLGETGLAIAKRALSGYKQRERYAEHVYLEAWVNDVRVIIVPCYKTARGEWLSAADRSPYHTQYVIEKLEAKPLEDDIRVFKRFIKGIEAYGAEIRVKGLSGYLCELLILHYGSFSEALKAISKWRFGVVIDPEKFYVKKLNEVKRLFSAPLIVIDPVDQNRNVAAAVSKEQMSELIAATRFFLDTPSKSFFFPEKTETSSEELQKILSHLNYDIMAIEFRTREKVPDILWGELSKTQSALRHILEKNDFVVLRSDVWSDEFESSVIVFSVEKLTLGRCKRHLGPPGDTEGVKPFLEKYATDAIIGPWVENGKWVVVVKRHYTSAESLLKDTLSDGGSVAGVSRGLVEALVSSRLLVGTKILGLCRKKGFSKFLDRFLRGRPQWLSSYHSSSSSDSFP
ncbi:CCA tRNA nucleotidyltransferase [Candidatus Bathyarchaeota archaeon]|nr:CCA tRNA nucleotidyltransferase [Candidatus Bathyarchaeota archaeon]